MDYPPQIKVNRTVKIVFFMSMIIVKNGKIQKKVLEHEKYSKKEVFSRLREKDVRFLEEVETAIIEESGDLSVYTRKKYRAQTDLTNPDNL